MEVKFTKSVLGTGIINSGYDDNEPESQGQGQNHISDTEIDEKIPSISINGENNNTTTKLKSDDEEVSKRGWKNYGGIIFAFIGSIAVTMASLLVKVLDGYDPFTLGFYRYAGSTIFTLPFMLYYQCGKKQAIFSLVYPFNCRDRQQWILIGLLVAMSSTNCGAFVFRYFSIQYMTVADGTILGLSGAFFVILMSHFFLDEKCTIASVAIAIWTFSGVVIIARPPLITGKSEFDQKALIGTTFGIAAMFSWAVSVVTIRKTRKIHFAALLMIRNAWGCLQCGIFLYILQEGKYIPDTLKEGILLLIFISFSYVGALATIFAMKYDNPVSFSMIRSGDIVFAYTWQFIFLAVIPDSYSVIGAAIVIIGITLSTFRKWVTLPGKNKLKRIFKFLK